MGVPAFFRWLTSRYPKILMDAFEENKDDITIKDVNKILKEKYDVETEMPLIDNLYLDFNGIIHPCCHPENKVSQILIFSLNLPLKKRCLIIFLNTLIILLKLSNPRRFCIWR